MTSTIQTFSSADKWEQFQDVIPNFDQTTLISNSLLEQMNVTKDKSDYLWYTLRLVIHKYIHLSDIRVQIYLTCLFIYRITYSHH